jgi:hypothetical protein
LQDSLKTFVAVFVAVNVAVLVAFIIYKLAGIIKKRRRQDKVNHFGDSAEERVAEYLKKGFPHATLIRDVFLKSDTGLTEIDQILICNKGIFLIEIKSHNGYIITRGRHWTQRYNDKVVRFYNPTLQNKAHLIALENILKKRQSIASLPIYTVTVFTSSKVTFSENVKDVIRLPMLARYVRSKPFDARMTDETVKNVERLIRSYMETSRRKQERHRRRLYKKNDRHRAYRVNRYSVK